MIKPEFYNGLKCPLILIMRAPMKKAVKPLPYMREYGIIDAELGLELQAG
jgi:hypothetical protein